MLVAVSLERLLERQAGVVTLIQAVPAALHRRPRPGLCWHRYDTAATWAAGAGRGHAL
jgi:hypothetical protein